MPSLRRVKRNIFEMRYWRNPIDSYTWENLLTPIFIKALSNPNTISYIDSYLSLWADAWLVHGWTWVVLLITSMVLSLSIMLAMMIKCYKMSSYTCMVHCIMIFSSVERPWTLWRISSWHQLWTFLKSLLTDLFDYLGHEMMTFGCHPP